MHFVLHDWNKLNCQEILENFGLRGGGVCQEIILEWPFKEHFFVKSNHLS